jgi:hypothetical protein
MYSQKDLVKPHFEYKLNIPPKKYNVLFGTTVFCRVQDAANQLSAYFQTGLWNFSSKGDSYFQVSRTTKMIL